MAAVGSRRNRETNGQPRGIAGNFIDLDITASGLGQGMDDGAGQ